MAFACGRRGGGWAAPPSCLATSCLATFLLLVVVCLAEPQPLDQLPVKSYAYASFQPNDSLFTLRVLDDAGIDGGALQLTRDGFRGHRSGSVLLYDPFTLWRRIDDESPAPSPATATATAASGRNAAGQDQRIRVVSFNSTFSMSVAYDDRALPGEGLAFLIAPSSAGPPTGSQDGFLGLTNATLEVASPAANQFVAVEFDTVKQSYDPNNNYLGLDIGTVVSNKTANLADFNITIATDDTVAAVNYTIWIEYDGVARHISVYMDVRGNQKPASPVLDAPLDLSKHVPEQSYIGFSGSTGATVGLNSILDWTLTIETFPEEAKKKKRKCWWIAFALCIMLCVSWCVGRSVSRAREEEGKKMKRKQSYKQRLHMLRSLPGMPREFSYDELKQATLNFSRERSGGRYIDGVLDAENGRSEEMEIAVGIYRYPDSDECVDDFGREISITNQLRHENIIPIIGWCYSFLEFPRLMLVYKREHMHNDSLDQHLFCHGAHEQRPTLSWVTRYGIIADVVSGIHYVHQEYTQVVLLRDINPRTIMLDASFSARLSELHLARVVERADRNSFTDFAGRKATLQADIFAFGIFVLEVVTGRHMLLDSLDYHVLSDWVWRLHGQSALLKAVDQRLGTGRFNKYEARRLLLLGLACCSPDPLDRPTMPQVLQIVSKTVPPPKVPPVKPTFVWPPEEDATEHALDESFRFPAPPPNNTQDASPVLFFCG